MFNSFAKPHFGGVWERIMRRCKKPMYAVLGNTPVTEDALSTTICFLEQTLNARPLTSVSSDVNDLEALTPNHCCSHQERLLTLSNMRRKICRSSKVLSTRSSLCKSHLGQIWQRVFADIE